MHCGSVCVPKIRHLNSLLSVNIEHSHEYLLISTFWLLPRLNGHVPHVKVGSLLIVVGYAPTDQDCTKEDQFSSDLDCVMRNSNGLAMVTGDYNASVSERMNRKVRPHRLGRQR